MTGQTSSIPVPVDAPAARGDAHGVCLDASGSMKGAPSMAVRAAGRLQQQAAQDEVAILAIRHKPQGYDIVSQFERDPVTSRRTAWPTSRPTEPRRAFTSMASHETVHGRQDPTSRPARPTTSSPAPSWASPTVLRRGQRLVAGGTEHRITNLEIPIPVYALAHPHILKYKSIQRTFEFISKNSFGIYYGRRYGGISMQQIVEEIVEIILNDDVATFRAYLEIDGDDHNFKLGVDTPRQR